jgi:hypothetical protein
VRRELEHVYVVRIWLEPGQEDAWRASVLDVHSKERRFFVSFQALVEFLDFTRPRKIAD